MQPMLMIPPLKRRYVSSRRISIYAVQDTHNAVVLAANGVGAARIAAANTDDTDGRATEAEQAS